MPPKRSEVWLADLGFAAKVRPVLVVSVSYGDKDYALFQVIPRTTRWPGRRAQIFADVIEVAQKSPLAGRLPGFACGSNRLRRRWHGLTASHTHSSS
jgi:mRNA-degrading endonuclease toxin of MazEF toxin-antitoxin module